MYLKQLWEIVPGDVAKQFDVTHILNLLRERFSGVNLKILDLGCGDGKSLDLFRDSRLKFDWYGLDIEDSPEVNSRTRQDGAFYTYDGISFPFSDSKFDIVYSRQVFEHIRYPEKVMQEVFRVLRPGGIFFGSVSYLEPLHSYSLFNFTPYGWYQIQKQNGMQPEFMAGGCDSISLINRSLRLEIVADDLWRCSSLNRKADSSTKRNTV